MSAFVNLDRVPDSDEFGIEISFAPHSDAPSRVFMAMTGLIEAFQEIDVLLAGSIRGTIKPSTLLEDIDTGSLRVWLRNVLASVDDESLKSGDWKKVVGTFLVKAKRIMIEWTEKRTTVTSAADLDELRQQILNEAAKTNVLSIPTYTAIPVIEVARSVELIADAVKPLGERDSIRYLSADPAIEISRSFAVVPEMLTELIVKESVPSQAQMILMVKRPDFLGEARWEFRHGKQSIEAKILDATWLAEFHNDQVVLMPGDALRAIVLSLVRYGYDGELVDSKHEILKVLEVIRPPRPEQGGLFMPPLNP
jgi:hypothetical protein